VKSKLKFISMVGIFEFSGVALAVMPTGQQPIHSDHVINHVNEGQCNSLSTISNPRLQAFKIEQSRVLVPGLFSSDEVFEITSTNHCRLPDSNEIADWATANLVTNNSFPHGIYWTTNRAHEVGFVYYVHVPSMKVLEFGNNFFQAYLLVICK